MTNVGNKALIPFELVDEGRDGLGRDLVHGAAVSADQMHVLRRGRGVVRGCAMAEVGVLDEAELFEELERPIDRRDVDRGRPLLDPGEGFFRSGMPELGHRVEHELALRRDAVALGPQRLLQLHPASLGASGDLQDRVRRAQMCG